MPTDGDNLTPANQEAEARVLGTAVYFPEQTERVTTALVADDFFTEKYRKIYNTLSKMVLEGEPIDSLTVGTRHMREGGQMSEVLELPTDGLSDLHLSYHVEMVKQESARRKLRHLFMRLQMQAVDQTVKPADCVAEALEAIGGVTTGTGNGHPVGWEAHKFLGYDMGDPNWIVEPFISPGDVAFITADAGVGKTWLLLTMALQAAMGEPWLGRFKTRPSRVLYVDFDNHKRGDSIRRRLLKLCHAAQISNPWDEIPKGNLVFLTRHDMPSAFNLYKGDGVREFVAEIKRQKYELVIVETFVAIHGAQSENSASEMGKVVAQLRTIGSETDCAFLISHHSRKPGANAPEVESHQSYRGSTAIKGGADTMVELSTEKPGILRLKHTKFRHVRQLKDTAISISDVDDGAGTLVQVEDDSMLISLKKDLCKGWLLKGLWELDNVERVEGYIGQKVIQEHASKLGYGSPVVIRDALRDLGTEGKLISAKGRELGLAVGGAGVYWKRETGGVQEQMPFMPEVREVRD